MLKIYRKKEFCKEEWESSDYSIDEKKVREYRCIYKQYG